MSHAHGDRNAHGAEGRRPTPMDTRAVVGTYPTYAEAERAVDFLSDSRFPVEHTAIAGRGLTSYEQVTGRLTVWGAGGHAALSGAIPGALIGWFFGVFDWMYPVISGFLLAAYGAVFGGVVGGAFGVVTHLMTGGRRDFASVSAVRAERYDLLVDTAYAAQAAQLLTRPGAPGRGELGSGG